MSDPDYVLLNGDDKYTRYFNVLSTAFQHLSTALKRIADKSSHESGPHLEYLITEECLQRLRNNVRALRVKNANRHVLDHPLALDLKDSGFPNHDGIRQMDVDIARSGEKLTGLKSRVFLKRELVDQMIQTHAEPVEILADLSDHSYFKMLNGEDHFFTQVFYGTVREVSNPDSVRRRFLFWCGYYDQTENLPYINFLYFEQDRHRESILERQQELDLLKETVRIHATRAGNMLVAIDGIDSALDFIYPLVLKRVCIGPLFTPVVFEGRDADSLSDREQCIQELLEVGKSSDDFLLFIAEEGISSVGESPVNLSFIENTWHQRKNARQIFGVEQMNDALKERGVGYRKSSLVLPHYVLQHASPKIKMLIPELQPNSTKFPYGKNGDLHVFTA